MPYRRRRREFMMYAATPDWVLARYAASGFIPDLAADFVNDRYWRRGAGMQTFAQFGTFTRATTGYQATSAGVWSSFGSGILRRSNAGARIEGSRVNSIRVNNNAAAVVGAPGALPTNMVVNVAGGLVTSVVAFGIGANGLPYIDLNIAGTSSGTIYQLTFGGSQHTAAVIGDIFTHSAYIALIAGSLANTSAITWVAVERDIGGTALVQTPGVDFDTSLTASLQRFQHTFTMLNASTVYNQPAMRITMTNASIINLTLRISAQQQEAGLFATSPMISSGSAFTRNNDVLTINNPIAPTALTVYAKATPEAYEAHTTFQNVVETNDTSINYRLTLGRSSATGIDRWQNTNNGTTTNLGSTTWAQGVSGKTAGASENGAQRHSFNGGTVSTGAGVFPTNPLTTWRIGLGSGVTYWYGNIEEVAMGFHRAEPGGVLQALTT